jgi:hypothetical protein
VAARYDNTKWVAKTNRILGQMHEDAAAARAIDPPEGFGEVHAAWMAGIDSYDGAATNMAIAIKGPDDALMSGCAEQLEDASLSLRRAMMLMDKAENGR